MRNIFVLLMGLILFFAAFEEAPAYEGNKITITILYDNYVFNEDLKTDWGFSCLVEGTEKTILFDTGTKSEILFHNINKLNINPKDIELIAISHNHFDHTGGLFSFLEKNNQVSVYLPISFPDSFVSRVENSGGKPIRVDKPVEICTDVYITGEMGDRIKEQSLILDTSQGLIIITGCSHQGIVNILKRAKEILDKKIYLVFGGFHLLQKSDEEMNKIIKEFRNVGVLKVGATHCTGDKQIEMFKKEYGEDFVQMGVGRVLELER